MAATPMISAKTNASGGNYWTRTKCELVIGQLSGGNRSGVGGKQKLCKPHTEQERGPRTHSLTPSLSVCTFLYMPLHVLCWPTVFSNICLSSLNAVQFVLPLDFDVTLALLSINFVYNDDLFCGVSEGKDYSNSCSREQQKQH